MHIVLWRRLDQEGHDACCYLRSDEGWTVEGAAVFHHSRRAAHLAYRLSCDRKWRSRGASVTGWIGDRPFDLSLEREDGGEWRVDGRIEPSMTGLDDIDLGFMPASNTNAIRRANLSEGSGADSVAVWLDPEDWVVRRLPQGYVRTGPRTFAYESPQHDYRATLIVDDFGAVIEYPGLWTMVRPE